MAAFALAAVPAVAGHLAGIPVRPDGELVRLIAPEPAIPLAAGSTAALEWAPLEGLARLRPSEEWEAFLSLDGGKSYTVRITPHLDSDLRRVDWTVPDAPSRDARILMRFGDERREIAIELPQRFTIAPTTPAAAGFAGRPFAAARRGESARPGEPGVVSWVEGSRRGAGWRQVATRGAALCGDPQSSAAAREPAATASEAPGAGPLAPRRQAAVRAPAAPTAAASHSPPLPLPPVDRLLQTGRRNE
ncbi:MAG TPA: hypothetical protein VHR45_06550 [Thermoanaerobaculia bacterium]|nr:hypothetical protein [Thermoanaerobaculia bacterium]